MIAYIINGELFLGLVLPLEVEMPAKERFSLG